jgi:hypothetical protein
VERVNVVWPWVLCPYCCAFPGEPCRVVSDAGRVEPIARVAHAARVKVAMERDVELRKQNIFDMAEYRRRKAS